MLLAFTSIKKVFPDSAKFLSFSGKTRWQQGCLTNTRAMANKVNDAFGADVTSSWGEGASIYSSPGTLDGGVRHSATARQCQNGEAFRSGKTKDGRAKCICLKC